MSSNDNVDIFICSHRDFEKYPVNGVYKIIHGEEKITVPLEQYVETPTDLSPMEYSLAEASRIYWLYKNYELKDYIGICHYRKYFGFWDNVPDMDELFKIHDVVVVSPILRCPMTLHYKIYHRLEDIKEVCEVVRDLYSGLLSDFVRCLTERKWYPCNMFIMKSGDFTKYCEFAFPIIHEFCRRRGWKCDKDIEGFVIRHKGEYLKDFYPNNTVRYQSRVLGYLFERITSCYIQMNFRNPKVERMILTEDIYKPKTEE